MNLLLKRIYINKVENIKNIKSLLKKVIKNLYVIFFWMMIMNDDNVIILILY
jgi:hypothetical protein